MANAVLFFGGTIHTMDESCPQVEALLTENGRITKAGTKEAVLACAPPDTRMTNLEGQTLMPAFLDGHSHFAGVATSLSQCDLSDARTFADIVALLKAFIRKNAISDGEWVTGTNYDHNFLQEKRHPDKRVLDAVSQVHPIVIVHASSHMGVANSRGLARQQLTAATPDPAGGHYGRLDGTDELSGYMEENAFVAFRNAMPMPNMADLMQQFRRAQQIYAANGITTIQEGMVTPPLLQILRLAQQQGVLQLDLVGYLDLEHCENLLTPESTVYDRHFRIGGYKIFLDGSPQGRTAWMQAPYEGATDGYCGYPIKTDEQLAELIEKALAKQQQLLAHCNGDAAAEQYLTQFERYAAAHPDSELHHPVMIHAQLVKPSQLERMASLGMTPSFFAAHTYYWGDIHIENFGMERAARISPAGTAARLGLPFTFHQDSPVLPPNVLETCWCATHRITKTGVMLAQDECVSIYEALKAATVYAARQYGEAADKGTLNTGKLADMVVLDRDPLAVPSDEVNAIRVMETFKAGVSVYKRG